MKPFIDESPNGFRQALSPEQVECMVDSNTATRLALVMHEAGMLTDDQFLRVIRPGYTVRVRASYDGDCQ